MRLITTRRLHAVQGDDLADGVACPGTASAIGADADAKRPEVFLNAPVQEGGRRGLGRTKFAEAQADLEDF